MAYASLKGWDKISSIEKEVGNDESSVSVYSRHRLLSDPGYFFFDPDGRHGFGPAACAWD
jgi:hypothetical protein